LFVYYYVHVNEPFEQVEPALLTSSRTSHAPITYWPDAIEA
jgi:hypothetical protein